MRSTEMSNFTAAMINHHLTDAQIEALALAVRNNAEAQVGASSERVQPAVAVKLSAAIRGRNVTSREAWAVRHFSKLCYTHPTDDEGNIAEAHRHAFNSAMWEIEAMITPSVVEAVHIINTTYGEYGA